MARVTFIEQREPVDEYGRALYAVGRSILRAHLDQLSKDDLTDLNSDRRDVTLRQLAKIVRLDRDKGCSATASSGRYMKQSSVARRW